MVALSARLRLEIPLPKNSINFSTTPLFLKISVIFKTRSVDVIPACKHPEIKK